MGFSILSKTIKNQEDVFSSIAVSCLRIGARFTIDEKNDLGSEREINLYVEKKNGEDREYFWIGIHSKDVVSKNFELLEYSVGDYYQIAGTDNDKYPVLLFNIGKAYLEMNPDDLLSTNGELFFSLSDLCRLEDEGVDLKDWCYYDLPWQKEST